MSTVTGAKYAVATITANQLNGAINNSVTSIVVDSTTNFASSGTITIEDEQVNYTGLSGGTTFTGCTRGANGTTAASHADNTTVIMGTRWQVYVTTTPFSSGDFGQEKARIIAVFDSTLATFKGIAFVRAYRATNQLDLMAPLYHPKDNLTRYITNGDKVYVSKNWSESTGTDIAYSYRRATLTNTECFFGTAGDPDSVIFYDEGVHIYSSASVRTNITVNGGVVVHGYRDAGTGTCYKGCLFYINDATTGGGIFCWNSSSAFVACYGCQFASASTDVDVVGVHMGPGQYEWGTTSPGLWVFEQCLFEGDVVSNGSGTLTDGTVYVLRDNVYWVRTQNSICCRPGNGTVRGGIFKLTGTGPISITGDDNSGTFNSFRADASQRIIVSDMGIYTKGDVYDNAMWRCYAGANNWTINFVNVITPDRRAISGSYGGHGDATGSKCDYYYEDNYTNLLINTNLAVFRNADMTIDESKTADATTESLKLYHERWTGRSKTTEYGPWTARIRLYGYGYFEYAIADSQYLLDAYQFGDNVAFGGLVNQLADTAIVLSQANADAVTGVTVTDHGGSPVSWQGKSWGITVTGNLSTNPALTASKIYDHFKSGISKLTSFNSKTGILWHDALSKIGAFYRSSRGLYSGSYKGVRIVDQNGNPFPGFDLMTADDGTTYLPPTTVTVKTTVKDVDTGSTIDGARVLLYASTGTTVTITRSSSTATVSHTAHGYQTGQKVVILGADQGEYNGVKTITYISDNSYSYTVSGSPATPATGTIKSHRCILDGATSSGVVQDTGFIYTGDITVTGRVRKTTAAPYYKTGSIAGTISSSGFDTTVLLVGDP